MSALPLLIEWSIREESGLESPTRVWCQGGYDASSGAYPLIHSLFYSMKDYSLLNERINGWFVVSECDNRGSHYGKFQR